MFKRMISVILCVVMIMSMGVTAFAAEISYEDATDFVGTHSEVCTEDLMDQLNSMDFGREVNFTLLPNTRSVDNEMLQFDSIEEFEIFLRDIMASPMQHETFGAMTPAESFDALSRSSGWWTNTVWWWGGGNTSLFSMTNADVHFFRNNNGVVSSITVRDSWMTGLVGATWRHRSGSATATGGTNARITVNGTWTITVSIYGLAVGASFNDSITSPNLSVW